MANVMAKAVATRKRSAKKKDSGRRRKSSRRKEKKKTEAEPQSNDGDSSDDEDNDRTEEEKPKSALLPPTLDNRAVLLGALKNAPDQPSWFIPKLLEEERSDLVEKHGSSELEAGMLDILDIYMRNKEDLQPGDLVITDDNVNEESREYSRYEVVLKYNEGRYSALYVVVKQTCIDNEEAMGGLFAMKTGLRKSANTDLRFKRELSVLRELKKASALHAPILVDSGQISNKNYIVMNLLDRNLEKLKEHLKGVFRPSSVYHLAGEALSAIELHAIGYIHRDIKPTNFCVGLGTLAARLFLIDYGDTVKNGKNIKYGIPDAYSLPYWAVEEHKRGTARPKVDFEAWFYTFAELMHPELLSWKECDVETEIEEAKTKFWKEVPQSVVICSPEFIEAAKIVQSATDKVDYNALKRLMEDGTKFSLKGAPLTLEWMKGTPEVNPKNVDAAVAAMRTELDASEKKIRRKQEMASSAEDIATGHYYDDWKAVANNLLEKFRAKKRKVSHRFRTSQKSTESGGSGEATSSATTPTSEISHVKPASEDVKSDRMSPGKLIEMISLRARRKKTVRVADEKGAIGNNTAAAATTATQEKPQSRANEDIAKKERNSAENISKEDKTASLSMKLRSREALFQKISARILKKKHLPHQDGTAVSTVPPLDENKGLKDNACSAAHPLDPNNNSREAAKSATHPLKGRTGSQGNIKSATHTLDHKKGSGENSELFSHSLPDKRALLTKLNKYSQKKKSSMTTSTGGESIADGTIPPAGSTVTQKNCREGHPAGVRERSVRSIKKKANTLWKKLSAKEGEAGDTQANAHGVVSTDKKVTCHKQVWH